ncbi:unnamed protein product [Prunus armeniaca]|uniref:Retroviral polymerase SH3-like domain-containing protein n=1 Tax=Prunus armeniaca TaxID=36596 RepID=A0A6J5WTS2_PRUAR|nr:unnamed protein product [Prunus armeniaca]
MVPYNKHKLLPKIVKCGLIGYDNNYKGYRCLDIASRKVCISRNVQFDELTFPYQELKFKTTQGEQSAQPLSLEPITLLDASLNSTKKAFSFPHEPIIADQSPTSGTTTQIQDQAKVPFSQTSTPSPLVDDQDQSVRPIHLSNEASPQNSYSSPHASRNAPVNHQASSISPTHAPDHENFKSLNELVYETHRHPLPQGLTTTLQDPLSLEPSSYTQASKYPP